jgi:hypothetical protein
MKLVFRLHNAQQGHDILRRAWDMAKPHLIAGTTLALTIATETRSTAQNSLMWAALTDVSEQVVWHGRRLTAEEWKHVFSASLKRQDVVPGLDGGFVVLGQSTSQMTKREMTDLIDLIHAFGAQHGVTFHEPAAEPA